jgi:hypothetical protein
MLPGRPSGVDKQKERKAERSGIQASRDLRRTGGEDRGLGGSVDHVCKAPEQRCTARDAHHLQPV